MDFDLIDKKLDSFVKYQRAIISSTRSDYVLLSLLVMVLALGTVIFFITNVHHRDISKTDTLPLTLIFPGPILIGLITSFVAYSKNKNRSVCFNDSHLEFKGKIFDHESIWFVEILGPNVLNIQMRGITGFRFG